MTDPGGFDDRTLRTADGAEIAYRFRPGREPCVLLHGLGCDASMWDPVVAGLPGDRGMLIPDLRGHGASTLGWRPPSIDLWAGDVAALIDRERVARPAVTGLSMGGYTALALAALRPDLARGWGFVSTQARDDDEATKQKRADGLATIRRRGWPSYMEGLIPVLFEASRPDFPANRDRMMAMAERAGDTGLAAALHALANRPDRRDRLPRIGAPAVALVGEVDRLTPPDRAREIAEHVPGCRLVVLPGVAHMSALEAPLDVAQAVSAL